MSADVSSTGSVGSEAEITRAASGQGAAGAAGSVDVSGGSQVSASTSNASGELRGEQREAQTTLDHATSESSITQGKTVEGEGTAALGYSKDGMRARSIARGGDGGMMPDDPGGIGDAKAGVVMSTSSPDAMGRAAGMETDVAVPTGEGELGRAQQTEWKTRDAAHAKVNVAGDAAGRAGAAYADPSGTASVEASGMASAELDSQLEERTPESVASAQAARADVRSAEHQVRNPEAAASNRLDQEMDQQIDSRVDGTLEVEGSVGKKPDKP